MADRVIQRNDTAARWQSINPILATGEIGIEIDGAKGYKIGDGKTRWNDLPYPANPTSVVQELGDDENAVVSQKVVSEKFTELDSNIDLLSKRTSGNSYYIRRLEDFSDIHHVLNDGRKLCYAIVDSNGNIAWGITDNGQIVENIPDNIRSLIDKNINDIYFELENYKDNSRDDVFGISDENNNLSFLVDKYGNIHLNDIIHNGKDLYIVDSNGNIAVWIDKKGIMRANIYKNPTTPVYPDYQIPERMFTVLNDCYSDTISEIKRNYVPLLRIERITSANVLIGNSGKNIPLVHGFTKMPTNDRTSISISNSLRGKEYDDSDFSFILHTTKNSVLIDKDIRLLCLGDSITDMDWWTSYVNKMIQMDNIDYKKKMGINDDRIKYTSIGTRKQFNMYNDFTYRGIEVNTTDYNEGRSSWAAATYLRHACLFTWDSITYNGESKGILHVAWRVLGLYEKIGKEFDNSQEHKDMIRYTCSGQYPITINCIDGWVWNHFKNKCSLNNIVFENASDSQKISMLQYLSGVGENNLLDNPDNPFFSIKKVNETKNSDNCYAFDWNTFYDRYKTHSDDGIELLEKGVKAVDYSHVCNPNYIAMCLGTNDSAFGSEPENFKKIFDDVYKIASLLKDSTNAKVMIFQNAYPVANFPELSYEQDLAISSSNINNSNYLLKNKILQELCGNSIVQKNNGIFYCPSFYMQRQSCYDRPFQDIGTEEEKGYIVSDGNVHPDKLGYADIGYEVYAMLCFLITL